MILAQLWYFSRTAICRIFLFHYTHSNARIKGARCLWSSMFDRETSFQMVDGQIALFIHHDSAKTFSALREPR